MKHILTGCIALAGLAITILPETPAEARGGVNASYARAYCLYYRNKASLVARDSYRRSHRALAERDNRQHTDRNSPAYWRQVYRECLKEHGY
ncbi:MAG: hypothetical protein ACR2OM_09960 [Aestuariivirgaceae bacterium]